MPSKLLNSAETRHQTERPVTSVQQKLGTKQRKLVGNEQNFKVLKSPIREKEVCNKFVLYEMIL